MLNLSIQKNANISIHQQLVTQISLQIASGILPEGTKLPSIRGLSQKLDIHYNTCLAVYKELSDAGLVQIKKGSGVTVAKFMPGQPDTLLETNELQQMAKYFVQATFQKGYRWEEVEIALQIARQQWSQKSSQLTFMDVHADIMPIFQAELSQALNQSINTLEIASLTDSPERSHTTYLVSRYHFQALKSHLSTEDPVIVIDVGNGQEEAEVIKALPEGALVTIVSHSHIILDMGEAVITGLRGHDILVRRVLYSEGMDEILKATQYAQMVIFDYLCAQEFASVVRKPNRTLRLVPDSEIEKIKQQLATA